MKRLLVIDDDPKVTAVFAEFFAGRYLVETASSGADGVAAVERNRPDAVLLDISMPEMNGLQVLRRIKDLDERIPVIMVTGNSEVAVAEAALRAGAFAYLPKPFQLQYADHLIAAAIAEPGAR